jgi:hypothetical protein
MKAGVHFDYGSSRIWNGDSLHAAKDDDSFGMQCDYELETLIDLIRTR